MNIRFRNSTDELPRGIADFTEKKLVKLKKFVTERNYEAQVFVDVNKESGSNSSETMWRASINVEAGGEKFNASELADTPETAVDRAIRELIAEVRTAHGKQRSIHKRGGEMLKRLVRGFR